MKNSLSAFGLLLMLIVMVIVLLLVAKAWQSMAPTAVQVTAPQLPGVEGLSVDGDNATVEEEGEGEEDNQRLPDLQDMRESTDEHAKQLEEARKQIDQ